MILKPEEITAARERLGEMWGLDRRVTMRELGEILMSEGGKPGDFVARMESGEGRISGPTSLAITAMLQGWLPPGAPAGAEEALDRYFDRLEALEAVHGHA